MTIAPGRVLPERNLFVISGEPISANYIAHDPFMSLTNSEEKSVEIGIRAGWNMSMYVNKQLASII